jgi:hypothetical protein
MYEHSRAEEIRSESIQTPDLAKYGVVSASCLSDQHEAFNSYDIGLTGSALTNNLIKRNAHALLLLLCISAKSSHSSRS